MRKSVLAAAVGARGIVDGTSPTLSSPSMASTTAAGGVPTVTTNEGNGTLYYAVLTDGGSCTDAQLKAGSGGNIVAGRAGSQAVSASGEQTFSAVTGLSDSTPYEIVFLHRDAAGNDSAQSAAGFSTLLAKTPMILAMFANAMTGSRFMNLVGSDGVTTAGAPEADAQFILGVNVTISRLQAFLKTITGSGTITFRESGANTDLAVTGSAGQLVQDLVDAILVEAGNPWALTMSTNMTPTWVAALAEIAGPSLGTILGIANYGGSTHTRASSTRLTAISGAMALDAVAAAARAQVQWKNYEFTSVDEMYAGTRAANLRTTDTTFQIEVNGSIPGGSLAVVVPGLAAAATRYAATGNAVALTGTGELINLATITGTGSEAISLAYIYALFRSTLNRFPLIATSFSGFNRAASATEHFIMPGGRATTQLSGFASAHITSRSEAEICLGFPYKTTRFRGYLIQAYTDVTTPCYLRQYKNGVVVAEISLGASEAAGWKGDVDSDVSYSATDTICFSVVGGTTGNLNLGNFGCTVKAP